jgi:ABC-2 type transport system permease protein
VTPHITPADASWRDDAACRDADLSLFFSYDDALVDEALALAATADRSDEPQVVVEHVTATAGYDPLSQSAAGNLVLFVFITSLVGSSALVETRRLGLSRRMLAAPTSARIVLLGEASARFAIALFQGVLVVAGAALLFGVRWHDPLAVGVIVVLISLAGTGAAMLMGARFANAEQASAIAVPLGIGLGMLGGCMWPLDIVPAPLQAIGRLTPHAWAMDGLSDVTMRAAGLADILPAVAILAAYGAVLLAVASWQLRRSQRP